MKQTVLLTCTAPAACSVIHFLLAKLAGYQHGADCCGFSEVSPYTTVHVNARKESAACPDHSIIQILMQMAWLGNSLSLQVCTVCANYRFTGTCEDFPLHPLTSWLTNTNSFHTALVHLSAPRARGKALKESFCYHLKLASGQSPFPSVNKDIKHPRATPTAFVTNRKSTDKVARESKGKLLFITLPSEPQLY